MPGTPTTYTITVSNAGPEHGEQRQPDRRRAGGAAQPGLRHAQPRAATTRRRAIWSGLSLAAGQSVTITLTGTIDPAATGSLTNTAHVAPPPG